jgi:hypothetical protein
LCSQAFLLEAVAALKVDVVVVLNQRLFRQLQQAFRKPGSPEVPLNRQSPRSTDNRPAQLTTAPLN